MNDSTSITKKMNTSVTLTLIINNVSTETSNGIILLRENLVGTGLAEGKGSGGSEIAVYPIPLSPII